MPQPSAVEAVYDNQLVSSFDIQKPEFLDRLIRRRGDQGLGYFRMLEALGFKMPASNELISHFEEDWIHETFHNLNLVGAPGAGNDALVTLEPQDLDGSNRFYPRLWDIVIIPDSEIRAQVTNVNVAAPAAPILTLTPVDVLDDIGAIQAGAELAIFTNAFSEGGDQPDGRFSGVIRYDNDFQILKEKITGTGTELTNKLWFNKIVSQSGPNKGITSYIYKGQLDADYRMELQIDGALLMNKRTTNTIVDAATGRQNSTTEGLEPYVTANGTTINYNPGTWSVQRFNEMTKTLDKEFAGRDICMLMGIDLYLENEDVMVDYNHDTGVDFTHQAKALYGGDLQKAMNVNFKSLTKGNHRFYFKQMKQWSFQKGAGATGYSYEGDAVVFPIGKRKDKKTLEDVPFIGMRYKELGGYSRMMEVWNINGAGPGLKVTESDLVNYNLRCHIAAHHSAGNQMIKISSL